MSTFLCRLFGAAGVVLYSPCKTQSTRAAAEADEVKTTAVAATIMPLVSCECGLIRSSTLWLLPFTVM